MQRRQRDPRALIRHSTTWGSDDACSHETPFPYETGKKILEALPGVVKTETDMSAIVAPGAKIQDRMAAGYLVPNVAVFASLLAACGSIV